LAAATKLDGLLHADRGDAESQVRLPGTMEKGNSELELLRIPVVPEGDAAPGILKDVVRGERLELSRLAALPPQDSASTNFATRALRIGAGIYNKFAGTRSDLCD
jgi:hypothetical protein